MTFGCVIFAEQPGCQVGVCLRRRNLRRPSARVTPDIGYVVLTCEDASIKFRPQPLYPRLPPFPARQFPQPMFTLIAIGTGEHERAFGWLEQCYADRAQMMSELNAEPAFDPLRADPRFADLLRRVGLEAAEPAAAADGGRETGSLGVHGSRRGRRC